MRIQKEKHFLFVKYISRKLQAVVRVVFSSLLLLLFVTNSFQFLCDWTFLACQKIKKERKKDCAFLNSSVNID
jgi:hypothetical protein